ncbi:MAG: hypothetical protein SGI88_00325 [Candidatus Hydrogenedentes bacterium]|nr:hypothetical protein [Candidatus Hydrogenedentota bacterium]
MKSRLPVHIELQLSLSVREALACLRSSLPTPTEFEFRGGHLHSKFCGKISKNSFFAYRKAHWMRNDFVPTLRGKFTPTRTGCTLTATIDKDLFLKVFPAIFVVAVIALFGVIAPVRQLQSGIETNLVSFVLFPLAGVFMAVFGSLIMYAMFKRMEPVADETSEWMTGLYSDRILTRQDSANTPE